MPPKKLFASFCLGLVMTASVKTAKPVAAPPALPSIVIPLKNSFYTDNQVYTDPAGAIQLPVSTPEGVGMKRSVLQAGSAYLARDKQACSFIVLKGGKQIWSQYFNGATANQARNIHSASKSILSCLVGVAIRDGYLRLDTTVGQVLGKKFKVPPAAAGITVLQLITMRSDFAWDEDGTENSLRGNFAQGILNLKVNRRTDKKGQIVHTFNYSTGDAYLLGVMLQEATQKTIPQLLATWGGGVCYPTKISQDSAGYFPCCCNFYLTPSRMAAFGQTVLNGLKGQAESAAPRAWVTAATSLQVPSDGYGYYWWVDANFNKHQGFRAWGWGKQFVYVFPKDDLVVVLTHDTRSNVRDTDLNQFVGSYVIGALN